MGLGDPWAESYLQHQQNEHYYVMFIYQSLVTHQNSPEIKPMGLGDPWSDTDLKHQLKEQSFLDVYIPISSNPPKFGQGSTQWFLVPLGRLLSTIPTEGTVFYDVYI